MDSGCFANHNFSRELDQLFCGLLSCCAELLQDDEDSEPREVSYIYSKQPRLLTQYGSDPSSINNEPRRGDESLYYVPKPVLDFAFKGGSF